MSEQCLVMNHTVAGALHEAPKSERHRHTGVIKFQEF